MARRGAVTGVIPAGVILAAVLSGLIPLVWFAVRQGGGPTFDRYITGTLWFTLYQAALSTLLSVVPAILVARALARRMFPGKSLLLSLFAVPMGLPVIVAILGLTQVYGNQGWIGGWFNLYGLTGILLAHVFFNLPLAVRVLLDALQRVPAESYRLANQLGLRGTDFFRHVEWPVLKAVVPRIAALIFLLCSASFVIVLTLGGGPSATTLEVAIYQSLRLDFDVARALALSLVQVLLCGVLVFLVGGSGIAATVSAPVRVNVQRHDAHSRSTLVLDSFVITSAAALTVPPMLAVLISGVASIKLKPLMFQALATSIIIAAISCALCLSLTWMIARSRNRWVRSSVLLGLIVPPAVLATGWFVAFRNWDGGLMLSVCLIAILNALMALPFAYSVLAPAIATVFRSYDRLCAQLDLRGWTRFRIVELAATRRAAGQAMLLAFALSLGDLTAVTMLGSQGLVTLPSLVNLQMGNYRSVEASGTALILAAICLLLARGTDWIGKRS
jgi:thiamine transport system permease protein